MPFTHNPSWHPPSVDPATLLNASANPIGMTDVSGCLVWQNEAFSRFVGLQPQECQGRHLVAVLSGREANLALPVWLAQRLAEGRGVDAIEYQGRRHDGGELHCRLTVAPFNAGLNFIVTLADSSTAAHLVRENERLHVLLETVQQLAGIGIWEREANGTEGRWDRHMFRLAGLPLAPRAPSLERINAHVHPDDDVRGGFLQSLRVPGDHSMRFRVMRPDGAVQHLHSQWRVEPATARQPARATGILRDFSESAELVRSFEDANTHLSLAVELGQIAMWRHDLLTGRVECNELLFRIFGIPAARDGFEHARWLAIVHPEDRPRVEAALAAARGSTGPIDLQARYLGPAGDWRYVLTRRVVQRDQHGTPMAFLGVAFDVTAQAADAQRALELAHTLEAASRAAGIGICAIEHRLPGQRRGWRSTWNAQMHALFRLPPQLPPPASLGAWVRQCVHTDDAVAVRRTLRHWLRRPSAPVEIEFRTPAEDGAAPRWLSLRVDAAPPCTVPQRLFGVVMDVTDRHHTMQTLQAAVERAELATHGVGIGTWERREDGTVLWDAQMFRLRDMPAQPMAPDEEARFAIVHPADREAVHRFHPVAAGAVMSPTYEFRIVLPDGRTRWLASRSIPQFDAQGRETRRIGVNWDITDNKNAELAQRERESAQRESQAKSRLLARISHELRTPLNAVLGVTQLMLMDDAPDDAALRHRQLAQVLAASRHLLSLIDGVLDLSAYEGGEVKLDQQPVDVAALAAQSLAMVEAAAAARGIVPELALHAAVAPLADPTRLRQVLVNLLSNAVKYNRIGGRVRLESHDHGQHVVLAVADTGHGLSAEQRRHLFQPFNRLGREHEGIEGTGIGLAIVQALTKGMRGRVVVKSTPGRGSRFEIWLPRAHAPGQPLPGRLAAGTADLPLRAEPQRARQRPLAALRHDGRGRVLYVEDNPVNAMIVQAAVAHRPHIELSIAPDGTTGLSQAARQLPDLVLLDMQLPDIDGHAVLRRLRADPATARIPCIALSANALPEDIAQALAGGFLDYWTKPIDLPAFLASLDALFGAAEHPRP